MVVSLLVANGCGDRANTGSDAMDPRAGLMERIGDINDFDRPRPLVELELFFEGNDDYGSIGYNLPDAPPPSVFYDLLRRLRDRDDVHDVLVEVKDLEDPEGWPATDTIWFVTTASPEEVRSWFPERLAPGEIIEGFGSDTEPYTIPDGHRAIGAWYD